MTRNQLDFLGLEETKRNNIVVSNETAQHNRNVEAETHRNNLMTEKQGEDRNAETKRNNIVTAKENKRHNKATEKVNTLVPLESARLTAEGRVAAANASASASRYATDTNRDIQAANRQNARIIAKANIKSAEGIEKLKSDTSKFLKSVDKLINNKNLRQKDRESLRQLYKDLKINNDKLDADATQRDLDRQVKLLNDTNGILAMLTVPGTAYSSDVANTLTKNPKAYKAKTKKEQNKRKPPSKRSNTGAGPAQYKSKDSTWQDKSSTKSHIRISTSKKSNNKKKNPTIKITKPGNFITNPLGKFKPKIVSQVKRR